MSSLEANTTKEPSTEEVRYAIPDSLKVDNHAPSEPQNSIDNNEGNEIKGKYGVLLQAQNYFHEKSLEDVNKRYGIDPSNKSLLGKVSNFFRSFNARTAGEYSDIDRARNAFNEWNSKKEKSVEEILKDDRSRVFQEAGERIKKIFGKTAVSGSIGLAAAAVLGGAVGGPVFWGAVLGSAAGRGLVELYRQINPKERNARLKIMETRASIYAKAASYENTASALVQELVDENTDDKRKKEIETALERLKTELIRETHFASFEDASQSTGPEAEKPIPEAGSAEIDKLSSQLEEKNKLEKRREKIAGFAAALGALGGGIIANVAHTNFIDSQFKNSIEAKAESIKSFRADFDHDNVSHIITKISPQDIVQSDSGFAEQLHSSGGYVFKYNPGELTPDLIDHVTTATLKDGSVAHVLNGMNDQVFNGLARDIANRELATAAATNAVSLWKEVVPVAAAGIVSAFTGAARSQSISKLPRQNGVKSVSNLNGVAPTHQESKESGMLESSIEKYTRLWKKLNICDKTTLSEAGVAVYGFEGGDSQIRVVDNDGVNHVLVRSQGDPGSLHLSEIKPGTINAGSIDNPSDEMLKKFYDRLISQLEIPAETSNDENDEEALLGMKEALSIELKVNSKEVATPSLFETAKNGHSIVFDVSKLQTNIDFLRNHKKVGNKVTVTVHKKQAYGENTITVDSERNDIKVLDFNQIKDAITDVLDKDGKSIMPK